MPVVPNGSRPHHGGGSPAAVAAAPSRSSARSVRPSTPAAMPSSSIDRVQPPSAGRSSSTAVGASWECTTRWVTAWASATEATGTLTQVRVGGSGCSRKATSVRTASVP